MKIFYEHRGLVILLVMFALLALAYSIAIPLGEAPDEVSHFAYVQYLVEHRRLPEAEGAVQGEAHQPPLYYLLGALVTAGLPNREFEIIANPDWELGKDDAPNLLLHTRQEEFPYRNGALAWHLIRGLSVLCGAITVWATHRLALQVFPNDCTIAIAAAAFIAFIPQFTFISGVVNNDNLLVAISTLALLFYLEQRDSSNLGKSILLGMALGLAALTKITALTLWMAIAFAILLDRGGAPLNKRLLGIAIIFGVAVLVISPWVIYNQIVFDDPINLARFPRVNPRSEPMPLSEWGVYSVRMFLSLWGRMGGVTNIGLPPVIYALLTGLSIIGSIGVIALAQDWRAGKLASATKRATLIFGLFGVVLMAAHIRTMISIAGMDQARQVFALLAPFCILIIGGILRLTPHHRARAANLVVLGMIAIGWVSWLGVSSTYWAPTSPPALTFASTPVSADFGETIRVVNYQIEQTQVASGDSIIVEIYWEALTDIDENYWLLLQLVDKKSVIAGRDSVPTNGRLTTDWWRAGQTFTSRHSLKVPNDTSAGMITIRLGLHPYGKWEWLPVRGNEMLTLGEIRVIRTTHNRSSE